jgi:hypothetical protein
MNKRGSLLIPATPMHVHSWTENDQRFLLRTTSSLLPLKEMTVEAGSNASLETLRRIRQALIDRAEGTDAKLLVGAAAYEVIKTLEAGNKVTNRVTV